MNIVEDEYFAYHTFDSDKWKVVAEELPSKTAYFYLANHLLNVDRNSEYDEIYNWLMWRFPDGILNSKLNEKFN